MSHAGLDEFESRLRRRSPAGPPADLRARVLARAAIAPSAGGRKSAGAWLVLAAVVVVAGAAILNSRIEGGRTERVGVERPTAGVSLLPFTPPLPLVMLQPRPAPLDLNDIRNHHRQLEALSRS
jgi:hypothetical protein